MDIEAIVKKHFDRWVTDTEFGNVEAHMRAALTELAAGYEKKIAGLESEAILSRALSERIRQLEAELAESLERIRQLEAALEIIAGRKQCADNTMSNAEVAMAALAAAPAKEQTK